jgi:hypothetical protein
MAITPPFTIDVESVLEAVREAVKPIIESAKRHAVAAEILQAHEKAVAKHGRHAHLPDGTGPEEVFDQNRAVVNERAANWALVCKETTDKHTHLGTVTWFDILLEEIAEAAEQDDLDALRYELKDAGAVIVSWILAIDERRER